MNIAILKQSNKNLFKITLKNSKKKATTTTLYQKNMTENQTNTDLLWNKLKYLQITKTKN